MKFTGEKFIPGLGGSELAIEHYQRYLSVVDLVKDKVVVDAACGEGYGSHILSKGAAYVYAVDIDQETIFHAHQEYRRHENIRFIPAAVTNIPLQSNSVDVFVSFETIEHVDEHSQRLFLLEIKRLLRKDGLLLISTPDKFLYSDTHDYSNEFHIKEFYKDGFYDFLLSYFIHVNFFYQDFQVASVLSNEGTNSLEVVYNNRVRAGKYIVAICSDEYKKTHHSLGSVVYDLEDSYRKNIGKILELQREVEKLGNWGNHLNTINVSKAEDIRTKQHLIDDLSNDLDRLRKELDQARQGGARLQSEIEHARAKLTENEQALAEKDHEIEHARARLTENEQAMADQNYELKRLQEDTKTLTRWMQDIQRCMTEHLESWRWRLGNFLLSVVDILLFRLKRKGAIDHIQWILREFQSCHTDYSDSPLVEGYAGSEEPQIDLRNLVVERPSEVTASIAIYAYNNWELTKTCIGSIIHSTRTVGYEIIVADDSSTDETSEASKHIEGLKVSRNSTGLGYLKTCNKVGGMANGEYIVFLHNDVQVKENWLDHLVNVMEQDPTVGMVGPKILFPDGKLQEAGGIVWKNGRLTHYGHMNDPEMPEYNYLKEVDYVSGACFIMRKELWDEVGGFDPQYSPAHFEDVDLAFEVRKRGFKVLYQPKSVVVHAEGGCYGSDGKYDLINYRQINREKFLQKWSDVLEQHFEKGKGIFRARDRSRTKKTILIIDHYVPHFDKDAGSKSTFQYTKFFVKSNFNVKFLGDNFFRHEPYTSTLENLGVEVLCGEYYSNHWQDWLIQNSQYIDYVYMHRPHISIKYIDFCKMNLEAKTLYQCHDLHFLRKQREYDLYKSDQCLDEVQHWKNIEAELFRKTDVSLTFSCDEQKIIHEKFPGTKCSQIPLFIYDKLEKAENSFTRRKHLMYVGGFGHPPNIDAVSWFLENVFPRVVKRIPDIKFYVVGSKPPKSILASKNVIVTGFVTEEELVDLYRRIRLVVVPLRYGAGVKGKIVEAIYHNVPIVTTSVGAEGFRDADKILSIADTPEGFSQEIIELYSDVDSLNKRTQEFPAYITKYFSAESALRALSADIDFD